MRKMMRPRAHEAVLCMSVLAALVLAGCATTSGTNAASCTPVSKLAPTDTLVIGGQSFQVAVLRSSRQRTNGLLHACPLQPNEGALFIMPSARDWAFHTQGMTQHIEIAFLDADWKLLDWRDAPPGLSDLRGGKPATYVLEVAPGTMAKLARTEPVQAITLETAPKNACELVRRQTWQCPLTPAEEALQVTGEITGLSHWRHEKTDCALRLALCVMASADFKKEMLAKTYSDVTPDPSQPKNTWTASSYETKRDWSGKDVYAVLRMESGKEARQLKVKPATTWQELKSRLYGSHAWTNLHSNPTGLVSWWIDDSTVPALTTTLVHEWMHIAYFVDPDMSDLSTSVVYGSESFIEGLARQALERSIQTASTPAAP
jgi:uncharacterized membrane protein (UPF0127 family)